jgi:hypothetical protein
LVDTGAQFSCIRQDVIEFFRQKCDPCNVSPCAVTCTLADGCRSEVTEAVEFHIKLLSFSGRHEFKVLKGGPFPMILRLDFMHRTRMLVDVSGC